MLDVMTIEGEPEQPRPVRVIRFYPFQRSFIVEVTDGPVFALALSRSGIFYQPLESRSLTESAVDPADSDLSVDTEENARSEEQRNPTTVLSGRLQGQAKEGRVDGRGRPTAWARFLAHLEGQEGASLLSTTFHGRTRDIALGLPENAPITAQGYLRLIAASETEPRRLSSFSVIHVLKYPGKPDQSGS
jgi:hypothetical protein